MFVNVICIAKRDMPFLYVKARLGNIDRDQSQIVVRKE